MLQFGYRRPLSSAEVYASLALCFLFVLKKTRWGRRARLGWAGTASEPLWLTVVNALLLGVVTKVLHLPLETLYRETVLGPRLSRPEKVLPCASSKLEDVDGLQVHHISTTCLAEGSVPTGQTTANESQLLMPRGFIHFNHGFGACCLSWSPVMQALSDSLCMNAIAHDCPGFGLTERKGVISALSSGCYSLERNKDLTLGLVDRHAPSSISASQPKLHGQLILFGHSMGSIASAMAAAESTHDPKRTTLVLVAPALSLPNEGEEESWGRERGQLDRIRELMFLPLRLSVRCISTASSVLSLPFVMLGLRSIVYNGSFWRSGLRQAWHSPDGVTLDVINRYRWPSLVKDWDLGLALFAMPKGKGIRKFEERNRQRDLLFRLRERCRAGLRVLIVHGKQDPVIPFEKSSALAALLPESVLVGMEDCGHVPHEEKPSEFVDLMLAHIRSECNS